MKRVGIYLRLSNEDRDKLNKLDDSESIKNQRNMLIDYINKQSDFVLTGEYSDEDLSGAGTYRPQFEKLIKDCEDRKLDIVLCKSQSRFSRDMEIVEKYINNKFKEWNIRFIGLTDGADTLVFGNKKSRQINGLVNEWYLEDVSNNIRSAFNAKMKEGEFISPFAAFGYVIDPNNNNKLLVDPEASNTIKNIYNLYLSGMGFTSIAKYLNNKNIDCPSLYKYKKGIKLNITSKRPREEIKWNGNAIKNILTNELYLGHLIQGKRTTVSYKNHKIIKKDKSKWIRTENTHEAIIDKDIFNKVQAIMRKRSKPLKRTGVVHIFSGKVYCMDCKKLMRKKNSNKYEYLVCSNNHSGYDDCINKSAVRYEILENLVLDEINKLIKKYYDEEILTNLIFNKFDNRYQKEIKLLNNELIDIKNKIYVTKNYLKNVYEDKVNGIITTIQFNDLTTAYNNEENIYKEQIKSITKKIEYYKETLESRDNIKNIISNYKNLTELNRIIVLEFIDKIYIGKINKDYNYRDIQIKWNI